MTKLRALVFDLCLTAGVCAIPQMGSRTFFCLGAHSPDETSTERDDGVRCERGFRLFILMHFDPEDVYVEQW